MDAREDIVINRTCQVVGREPTDWIESGIFENIQTSADPVAGPACRVTRQRTHEREKSLLIGCDAVEFIIIAAHTGVRIHQTIDLVRGSVLENLTTFSDPSAHFGRNWRVPGDANVFAHAFIIDARPVAIFRDEADGERHIQVSEGISQ